MEIVKCWQIDFLKLWNFILILWCGFVWSGIVSLEWFIVVSYLIFFVIILDDFLIDVVVVDDLLLEEFGIDCVVCDSFSNIGVFYCYLCVFFQCEVFLENFILIEGMMWELGQEF